MNLILLFIRKVKKLKKKKKRKKKEQKEQKEQKRTKKKMKENEKVSIILFGFSFEIVETTTTSLYGKSVNNCILPCDRINNDKPCRRIMSMERTANVVTLTS